MGAERSAREKRRVRARLVRGPEFPPSAAPSPIYKFHSSSLISASASIINSPIFADSAPSRSPPRRGRHFLEMNNDDNDQRMSGILSKAARRPAERSHAEKATRRDRCSGDAGGGRQTQIFAKRTANYTLSCVHVAAARFSALSRPGRRPPCGRREREGGKGSPESAAGVERLLQKANGTSFSGPR